MSEIEAIGDAVTGGLVAGAIEPSTGNAAGKGQGKCLNCGCALDGAYCHCCGQKAEVHRSLGAFWHDLIHGVFHFEGKTWRTLPLLAWRPGDLTRRYIEGERASFVSPMALFLFSAFLMFIVFTTVGGPFDIQPNMPARAELTQADRDEPAEALDEIRSLEARRRSLVAAGRSTAEIDVQLRVARNAVALADRLGGELDGSPVVVASAGTERGAQGRLTVGRTGVEIIDQAIAKAEANPDLLLYKLQNNAYKFSWLLIPLSVPLVWLLFLHRRRYRQFRAYDHVVFVTYSIAFMTLGLVALTILRLVGVTEAIIGLAVFLVPPVHIYRQLRGAYSLSRLSALWRTVMLLAFAVVAAGLFLGILVLIGVIG